MKIIASQKVTYQINDNEFETLTESQIFNEEDTLAKVREWANRQGYFFYKSAAVQLMLVE